MNAETTVPPAGDIDDPEVAFEAMSRKLAGLTAAVEGFAARQQELHARDYSPDLAKIHALSGKMVDAINKLAAKPSLALTPETLSPQIAKAGEQVRAVDHQAWVTANWELGNAIQSLKDMVASAMKAETQKLWILGASAAALVLGFAFGTIIPTKIAQSVPESWYWPEQQAAEVLRRPHWEAGMRLLQVADPARLRALESVARLATANAQELADCRERAARSKVSVKCRIEVATSLAD